MVFLANTNKMKNLRTHKHQNHVYIIQCVCMYKHMLCVDISYVIWTFAVPKTVCYAIYLYTHRRTHTIYSSSSSLRRSINCIFVCMWGWWYYYIIFFSSLGRCCCNFIYAFLWMLIAFNSRGEIKPIATWKWKSMRRTRMKYKLQNQIEWKTREKKNEKRWKIIHKIKFVWTECFWLWVGTFTRFATP